MLYIVCAFDKPGAAAKRREYYARHIADLDAAASMSVDMKLGGPILGADEATAEGSFFLLEAPSIVAVKTFIEANAFAKGGVWEKPIVRAFRRGRGVSLERSTET